MVHLISFFFFVPLLSLLDCIKSNLSHHYLLPSTCLKDVGINQAVVAAHTFSPSPQEAEAGQAGQSSEFEASLVYRESSKTAKATQINRVLKKSEEGRKEDGCSK